MKVLGWFIAAVLLLAAVKAAIAALVLLSSVVIGLLLIVRPKETLAVLAALAFIEAFKAYPAAGLIILFAAVIAARQSDIS